MTAGRAHRGFTLIELMLALLISALLVAMVLAIFMRMSLSFRSQQEVANVQRKLATARAMLEIDAKQAGGLMPQGLNIASAGTMVFAPVSVINRSDGPDEVRFVYADTTVQAAVTSNGNAAAAVPLDDNTGFRPGDIVVLASPDVTIPNPEDPAGARIATYQTCVLRIAAVPNGVSVKFETAAPYGQPGNTHCPGLQQNKTMLFKLIARAYRIDPARPAEGVLQVSPSGNLYGLNDWQDLAFGFVDLQVATQFYDGDTADTLDPDTDPKRDWYSGDAQETLTQSIPATGIFATPLKMTLTLVARNDRDLDGLGSPATPNLAVAGNSDNNMLGDRSSVTLPSATDPALQGNRIYRYTTFTVDFRNLGVGR